MKTMNNFIWTDLSTFDLKVAKEFYASIFNWQYYEDDDYQVAFTNNFQASGLYLMPDKFQRMNMPSFWMSYIQVANVNKVIEKAKQQNGIIEVVENLGSFGKIALVRDPLGAGFTVYEGHKLNGRTQNQVNTLVWNELFVSNAEKVLDFYTTIFDWEITYEGFDRYIIKNTNGDRISAIQQVDNAVKGKHEYWGVFFKTPDLEKTKENIIFKGGNIVYEDSSFVLCTDPFHAIFHLIK